MGAGWSTSGASLASRILIKRRSYTVVFKAGRPSDSCSYINRMADESHDPETQRVRVRLPTPLIDQITERYGDETVSESEIIRRACADGERFQQLLDAKSDECDDE